MFKALSALPELPGDVEDDHRRLPILRAYWNTLTADEQARVEEHRRKGDPHFDYYTPEARERALLETAALLAVFPM